MNTFNTATFSYANHPDGFGYVVVKTVARKYQADLVEHVSGRIFSEQAAIKQVEFMKSLNKIPSYEERTTMDRVIDFAQTTNPSDMLLLAGAGLGAITLVAVSIFM